MADPTLDALVNSVSTHLEPREVMDYLYQEHALSEEDMDLVNVKVTRKDRCRKLVERLVNRDDKVKALETFVDSLKSDYSFLVSSIAICVKSVITSIQESVAIQTRSGECLVSVPVPYTSTDSDAENRLTKRQQARTKGIIARPLSQSGVTLDRRVHRVFNILSNPLNKGDYSQFRDNSQKLMSCCRCPADVRFTVFYLQCCEALFQNDLSRTKVLCEEASKLLQHTSNPLGFSVDILSKKAWRYFKLNKLSKLESCLRDAMQLIHQDPLSCSGKAAGWIYVDHARLLTSVLAAASPRRSHNLRQQALRSLEEAIEHFKRENSNDGLFGQSVAFVKYASLLLQCGENMQFSGMNLTPSSVDKAKDVLRFVEESELGVPEILRVTYYTAMSDLRYRQQNVQRALEYATDASELSGRLGMSQEQRHAVTRVDFYQAQRSRGQVTLVTADIEAMWAESARETDTGGTCVRVLEKDQIGSGKRSKESKKNAIVLWLRFIALLVCIIVGIVAPMTLT
ncbi:uncharacterized protein LOC124267175 [Haliotis rubra]|uniref:uncharacterized protein LOC124267175 n=1 Tax=Haliotis rubra TaxID=36100 RepID=UPI001EE5BCBC|nr:uncharacterized protein LOC124267175 [Haliotis rubra]